MHKRLVAEVRGARRAFALSVALSVAGGLLIVAQAALLSIIIDAVFLRQAVLTELSGLLALLALVIGLCAAASWGGAIAAGRVAVRVKADLRRRLIAHLVALGPTYIQGERSGELVLAATEGIDALDAYFRDYLPGLLVAALVPLTILAVVFPLDALTFAVLVLTAPLIPLFMALIGRGAGALARRQYDRLSRMGAHFLDVLQGLTTLKLFNRSQHQVTTIARITDQFRAATMDVLRVAFLSAFMLELLSTLSIAIVAVEIGVRLLNGGIGFQQALFLLIIAPEYYLPLRALGARFHAGTQGQAAADRIFTVLDTPLPDVTTGAQPVPEALDIRFEAVTYAYDGGARPALNGLSITIQPGQRVALVGASGAGKSTAAALLLRFIAPDSGRITISGVDLAALDVDGWRRQVAWVPQTPYLFNTSIADNIRLADPGAPLEAVIQAAQAAEAHHFIDRLPQGYATPVGERGLRLSGGQAQRIALARAFLKDAPLLILDEATANLDYETEALIQAAITRLMQGRTVLVIAHRLNTVASADHIVVLADGRAVEQGTHAGLMRHDGTYRRLVESFGAELYAD